MTALMLLLPLVHVCFRLDQHGLLISDLNTGKSFYCFVSPPLKWSLLSMLFLGVCFVFLFLLTDTFWQQILTDSNRTLCTSRCLFSACFSMISWLPQCDSTTSKD